MHKQAARVREWAFFVTAVGALTAFAMMSRTLVGRLFAERDVCFSFALESESRTACVEAVTARNGFLLGRLAEGLPAIGPLGIDQLTFESDSPLSLTFTANHAVQLGSGAIAYPVEETVFAQIGGRLTAFTTTWSSSVDKNDVLPTFLLVSKRVLTRCYAGACFYERALPRDPSSEDIAVLRHSFVKRGDDPEKAPFDRNKIVQQGTDLGVSEGSTLTFLLRPPETPQRRGDIARFGFVLDFASDDLESTVRFIAPQRDKIEDPLFLALFSRKGTLALSQVKEASLQVLSEINVSAHFLLLPKETYDWVL